MVQSISSMRFMPLNQTRISPTAKRMPTAILRTLPRAATDTTLVPGIRNQNFLPMLASGEAYVNINDLPLALQAIGSLTEHDQLGSDAQLAYATVATEILRQAEQNPFLRDVASDIMGQLTRGEIQLPELRAREALEAINGFTGLPDLVQTTRSALEQQLSDVPPPPATSNQQPATSNQPDIIIRLLAGGQEGTISDLEELGGITNKGGRANQEDAVVVYSNTETEVVSIGVFDGMGGHSSGEVASRLAAEQAEIAFKAGVSPTALGSAHKRIFEASKTDIRFRGMGSTGIVARIADNKAFITSVGDSRAILVKADGTIVILTQDDNMYVSFYNAGMVAVAQKIAGADKLTFPLSNEAVVRGYWQAAEQAGGNAKILAQALGARSSADKDRAVELQINTAEVELDEGDILILCSDGLYDFLSFEEFKAIVEQNKDKTPQEISQALHDAALKNMKPAENKGDNITVVVYKQPVAIAIEVLDDGAMGDKTRELLAEEGIPVKDIAGEKTPPLPQEDEDSVFDTVEASGSGPILDLEAEGADPLKLALSKQDPSLSLKEQYLNILADTSNPEAVIALLTLIREGKIELNPLLGDEPSRFYAIVMDAAKSKASGELKAVAAGVLERFEPELSEAMAKGLDGKEVENETEPIEGHVMTPAEREELKDDSTFIGALAVPAAKPSAEPEAAAPAEESSQNRKVDELLGAYHQDAQNQPRQGIPGALFPLGDDEEKTQADANMGPVAAAGMQGLGITNSEPTGPLAVLIQVLTQNLGPTTNRQDILDNLMEVVSNTSIITSVRDMTDLFNALTKLELAFPEDEELQGSLIFARAILRARYIELQGGK